MTALSTNSIAQPVYVVDGVTGSPSSTSGTTANPTVTQQAQNTYTLASNVASLAAQTGTTPVTGVKSGVYVWDAQFTGTGPLVLQSLGSDGVTWRTVASLDASGASAGGIRIGANAQVRVFNNHATAAVTSVYSSLS